MHVWRWFQPISFQLIWLTAILGGNQWLLLALFILFLHFMLSPCRQEDLRILPLALIGIVTDISLAQLGLFKFAAWPLWLPVLWLAFVLNFGHSLTFLRRLRMFWLMLIGALGGCYAYLASWKLGAVEFPQGIWITSLLLLIIWAIMLPLLVKADVYFREK